MKTFPTAFNAEKNKKTGIAPVWILKFTAGGSTYYLSDQVFTIPACTPVTGTWPVSTVVSTTAWVKQWGEIREGINNSLGEVKVSDLSMSFVTDKSVTPNAETLTINNVIEASVVELFKWYIGITDAPQLMFKGAVRDAAIPSETQTQWTIQDDSVKLEQLQIGTKLDTTSYPLADPDDIGKIIPIPYGTVEKLRALCVDGGWVSSLINGITTTQTVFDVSELPTYSLVGKTITIDDEEMTVTLSAGTNWAASSNGGSITATTTDTSPASAVSNAINGNRNSPNGYDRWISQIPPPSYPQTLTVTFAASKAIEVINLFFTAVNGVVADPTLETINVDQSQPSFNIYTTSNGGGSWDLVEAVTGNNKAWYQSVFASRTITGLKVDFTARTLTADWANCSEIEAYAYAEPTGKTLTVIRSSNDIVSEHSKGSVVIEKKTTPLVYLCSDQALTSIGSIYSRIRGILVDITSDCTTYLGTVGNQLAAYPGKAAVEIPQIAKVQQRIALALAGDVTANDYSHTHNAGASISTVSFGPQTASNTSAVSTELSFSWLAIQNQNRFPADQSGIARTVNFTAPGGTALTATVTASVNVSLPSTGGAWCLSMNGVRVTPYFNYGGTGISPTITLDATAMQGNSLSLLLFAFPTGAPGTSLTAYCSGTITSASRSGTYTSTQTVAIAPAPSGVTVTNTLELTGNSVSDIMIGEAILVDVTRSVTTPSDVLADVLDTYCGISSLTTIGTFPAYFNFDGAVTNQEQALKLLTRLAMQCAAYFRLGAAGAVLIARGLTLGTSDKTIPSCKITKDGRSVLSRVKTPKEDIINLVNLLYDRDYSKDKSANGYKKTYTYSDATSISNYGESERPELFQFDFVKDATMALDLAILYVTLYKDRKWIHTFETFLDHSELEFADVVTMGFNANIVGEVQEVRFSPGDKSKMDGIGLVVVG